MANPTIPRRHNNHRKFGEAALRRPYQKRRYAHNVNAVFLPYLSERFPQKVEESIIPKNTTCKTEEGTSLSNVLSSTPALV